MKLVDASQIENITTEPLSSKTVSKYIKEKFFEKVVKFCQENGGAGLAAPQIGLRQQFFVAFVDGRWMLFVNPKITKMSGSRESTEGCLSYPGLLVKTTRAEEVIVSLTLHGRIFIHKFKGQDAAIVQHEYDHLNGITIKTKLDNGEAEKVEKK